MDLRGLKSKPRLAQSLHSQRIQLHAVKPRRRIGHASLHQRLVGGTQEHALAKRRLEESAGGSLTTPIVQANGPGAAAYSRCRLTCEARAVFRFHSLSLRWTRARMGRESASCSRSTRAYWTITMSVFSSSAHASLASIIKSRERSAWADFASAYAPRPKCVRSSRSFVCGSCAVGAKNDHPTNGTPVITAASNANPSRES